MRIALYPVALLLLCSCRHPRRQVAHAIPADSTGMKHYFPFIGAVHWDDTVILTSMASHLHIFDEPPLQAFGAEGPAIRLYYQPAFNQWRMIRIRQHEIVMKSAWPHQDGFWYSDQPDSSRLSDGQRNQLRVLAAYHVLVDSKHPDTTAFLKTYHWLPYEQQLLEELRVQMRVQGTGRIHYAVEKRYYPPVILQDMLDLVYRSSYWHLPINHDPKPGMVDGSTWRLEVAAHGQHHVVYGRSPDSGAVYELGRRMLRQAAIPDAAIY